MATTARSTLCTEGKIVIVVGTVAKAEQPSTGATLEDGHVVATRGWARDAEGERPVNIEARRPRWSATHR
jgi:hypothetical protein